MNNRSWSRVCALPWLLALVLAACASDRSPGERDPFYDGLSAEASAAAWQAVQTALETQRSDETYEWRYGNGISGSVTPRRTFRIKTGHYCRDYSVVLFKGSQPAASSPRTACRGSQGTWRVVKP